METFIVTLKLDPDFNVLNLYTIQVCEHLDCEFLDYFDFCFFQRSKTTPTANSAPDSPQDFVPSGFSKQSNVFLGEVGIV